MGFLSELGKGFVRSAVNQVGRDTGKVISNSVFGDAHATPVRHVGQSSNGTYFDMNTNKVISNEQLLQYASADGWKPKHSAYKWSNRLTLMFCAIVIGSIPLVYPTCLVIPIVPIYIIYRGIKQLQKKQTTYTKTILVPAYKADARYKGGLKPDGMQQQEITMLLNSTDKDKEIHKRLGWSYILCAIFLWVAVLFVGGFLMKSSIN